MSSLRIGANVPAPTCRVTNASPTPRLRRAAKIASSKCSHARGATERARIDGLIAFSVRLLRVALNIRRQRDLPMRLKKREHIAGELQQKQLILPAEHECALIGCELHGGALSEALAGANMNQGGIGRQRAFQQ